MTGIDVGWWIDEDSGTATICTHGMHKKDLPELDMYEVPLCFMRPAARLLRQLCKYFVRRRDAGKQVLLGGRARLHGLTFEFSEAPMQHCECKVSAEVWQASCVSWRAEKL